MPVIPMGSVGMLFCCSFNSALILSNLKGNLSVILRDGCQNVCVVYVLTYKSEKTLIVSKMIEFSDDRVTLFIFIFYVL